MSLYPRELPWLHKPAAVAAAGRMIVDSALAASGLPGYLDVADPRAPRWLRPQWEQNAARIRDRELAASTYTAPADNLTRAFRFLARARRDVPAGSFVFVLSDFLVPPALDVWRAAGSLGWDVVPVIVQDPRWEQSFPDVSGFALPLAAPGRRELQLVRLSRREAAARRDANERRLAGLLDTFGRLELDPVLLSTRRPGRDPGLVPALARAARRAGAAAMRLRVAALAALLLLAVAFAAAMLRRPAEAPLRMGKRPVTVLRTLSPRDPQFGDTVVATVEVTVDPRRVDPDTVRVLRRYAPYRVVASTRTVDSSRGVSITRIEDRLRCLDLACVPPGDNRAFRFPAVRVSYPGATTAVSVARAARALARRRGRPPAPGGPRRQARAGAGLPAAAAGDRLRAARGRARARARGCDAAVARRSAAPRGPPPGEVPARADPRRAGSRLLERRLRPSPSRARGARPGASPARRAAEPGEPRAGVGRTGAAAGRDRGAGEPRSCGGERMTVLAWIAAAACVLGAVAVLGLRRRRTVVLQLADTGAFAEARRRTTLLWAAAAGVLVAGLLVFAVQAQAQAPDKPILRPGSDAVLVIDLSGSTRTASKPIARILRGLTLDPRRHLGLVLFSDTAYEALPPATPVDGLRDWLDLFEHDVPRDYPWMPSFSSGTVISSGLVLARRILRRDGVRDPHVVLVTDLIDAAPDLQKLETVVAQYQRERIDLKVISGPA